MLLVMQTPCPRLRLLEEPPLPPLLWGCPAPGASTWQQNRPHGWKAKPNVQRFRRAKCLRPEVQVSKTESASLNHRLFPGITWFGSRMQKAPQVGMGPVLWNCGPRLPASPPPQRPPTLEFCSKGGGSGALSPLLNWRVLQHKEFEGSQVQPFGARAGLKGQ